MRRLALLVGMSVACGAPPGDRPPAAAAAANPSPPVVTATHDLAWPEPLGDVLAVANPSGGEALLFRRDTLARPVRVGLIGYDSTTSTNAVDALRAVPCALRATMRLPGAPAGWNLALDESKAHPMLVDALDDLSPADSQRVVVRIQRALNTLPDTGEAMEFRGLPVVVRDAWLVRSVAPPLLVARAARLRNLEATAHEELRFVILEGDQPRYVARVAGDEEVVESWDLLAALMVNGRPWLAVAREGAGALQLEFVARDSTSWRSVWRSDAMMCQRR